MRVRVRQQDLENAISIVQKAIPLRSALSIGKGIYLDTQENKLKIYGNDLQIGIETFINAEVINHGTVVIDTKVFGDIIRRIKDEYVELFVDNNYRVEIKCENLYMTIMGLEPSDFPSIPQMTTCNSITIPENILSSMIRQTVFAVSKTQAHFVTTGVLLDIKDNQVIMVATDMYRLAVRREPVNEMINNSIRAIIPGSSLIEIGKILSDNGTKNVEIMINEKQVLFVLNNTKIIVRLISGEYIKYEVAFPKEYSTILKLNTNEFLDALEIASIFTQSGNNLVKFIIERNAIKIFAETELGNVLKEVKTESMGSNIEIGFNARYLIEMLRTINEEEIELSLSSSILPMVIKTIGKNNYSYLLFPVRLR